MKERTKKDNVVEKEAHAEGHGATDPQNTSSVVSAHKTFAEGSIDADNSLNGSEITEYQGTQVTEEDLKYRVFEWLRSHPKEKKRGKIIKLAADLCLDYDRTKLTLWQYSSQWKTESRFGAGPKCPPERHRVHVRSCVPKSLDRVQYPEVEEQAVAAGWTCSKNRNKELIWENDRSLGRVRWWRTGKVLLQIKKPQTVDRRNMLLAIAFGQSGLILDRNILVGFIRSFDLVEWHAVHRTPNGEKLPYMVIDNYTELLGFRIKLGDLPHRDAVEIEFIKPEWIERAELREQHNNKVLEQNSRALEQNCKVIEADSKAIQQFNELMKDLSQPKAPPKEDRSVV